MEMIIELLNNTTFVWGIMSVIILCLSQLLKLPIKCLTSKIKDNKMREMVNVTIMLIPLALGIAFDYFFCTYYLQTTFSIVEGVKIGATAVTLYAALEKFIKGNVSKSTQATIDLANEVTKDGTVDTNDISAVERFYTQVK